jgi:hypothetical protein
VSSGCIFVICEMHPFVICHIANVDESEERLFRVEESKKQARNDLASLFLLMLLHQRLCKRELRPTITRPEDGARNTNRNLSDKKIESTNSAYKKALSALRRSAHIKLVACPSQKRLDKKHKTVTTHHNTSHHVSINKTRTLLPGPEQATAKSALMRSSAAGVNATTASTFFFCCCCFCSRFTLAAAVEQRHQACQKLNRSRNNEHSFH